jgi:cytochrome b pre-mRNA-processing protein 3
MFLLKKRPNERRGTIERLYGAIVAQARNPVLYTQMKAPDTVEGRFDLVVLHLFLVNERLASLGEEGRALAQELLDFFFEDMDASLREIGIGDLSVPKKMRSLAEAYLGRTGAYQAALTAADEAALAAALSKNIYSSDTVSPEARALARYVQRSFDAAKPTPLEAFLRGEPVFADPEESAADAR